MTVSRGFAALVLVVIHLGCGGAPGAEGEKCTETKNGPFRSDDCDDGLACDVGYDCSIDESRRTCPGECLKLCASDSECRPEQECKAAPGDYDRSVGEKACYLDGTFNH